MERKLLLIFCLSFFSIGVSAQDLHLSQFYANDHLLNPAKVGAHDGQYRIASNYRNQWRQFGRPVNTSIIAADNTFNYYSYNMDGGIMVARDEFGGFNQTTHKVMFSAAYELEYKEHQFRFGIQPGIVFRNTDLSTQTFPVQWNYPDGSFDQGLNHQEANISENITHFDLNVGVMWRKEFEKTNVSAGFALNHINRPKNTYFVEFAERLQTRKVFHAEVDYHVNQDVMISPKVLFMSTTMTNETLIGSTVSFNLPSDNFKRIFAGAFYRHGVDRNFDAFYPVIGFTYNQFDVGFSHDFHTSGVSAHGAKTTFELSIIYTAPNFSPKFITLPCDRY